MEISNATVFSQYAADNAKNKSFSFVFCVFLFSQFLCFYQIILERFLQQQQKFDDDSVDYQLLVLPRACFCLLNDWIQRHVPTRPSS